MADEPSIIFFPLRTSVELFASRDAPEAITRAKLAALLYDQVIFEAGLLDVTIGETGGSHWWTPPDALTAEQLVVGPASVRPFAGSGGCAGEWRRRMG
jgi:hypothetical protein